MTAGVVLGTAIAFALVMSIGVPSDHRGGSVSNAARATNSTGGAGVPGVSRTTASSGKKSGGASHTSTASTPRPTTTTLPSVLEPASGTTSRAVYDVPSSSYTIGLTVSSGSCWAEEIGVDTGTVLWQGVVDAGQSKSVFANGAVEVDLGASSVAQLMVNGILVAFPAGFVSPLTVIFEPPA